MSALARLVFVEGVLDTARSSLAAFPAGAFAGSDGQVSLSVPDDMSLQLVEEHLGATSQWQMDITLGKRASLEYLKWQDLSPTTQHTASLRVQQAAESSFRAGFFAAGSESEHQHVLIEQTGAHATSVLYGFCQPVRNGQHLAHTVEVLHAAAHGQSRMLYKGILDAKSKASFRGRVKVTEAGKGVQASQANHYLLLSREAEANSRPELEIYQDDIQCSHGATVGQLDEAAVFYLCSRGIARIEAEKMLRNAFLSDLLEWVPVALQPWLQARLQGMERAS